MFHRVRPGPATPSSPGSDTSPAIDTASAAVTTPIDTQPLTPEAKEDAPMSNNFNNPVYTADTATDGAHSTNAQMPQAASFTPNRSGMPQATAMPRSPYGYGQQNYAPTAAEASVSNGRKLVISEGITMSGEIEACDHLVVEGTVEATLKGASVLDVSQSGMFFGAVEINEATVAGRFEGDLMVNGRLTVRSTGTVVGTMSYKELVVEAGATIDGKMAPISANRVATTEKKSGSVNVKAPMNGAKTGDAANELPFAGNKVAAA
jgi:cytoskeletal protein CcmA (bactofilin family)